MAFCDENDDGEVDCREAMRASAKVVLLIINTIWLLLGLGLLIVGIYAAIQFQQYDGLVDIAVLYVISVFGLLMMIVTGVGYIGILKLNKILLAIYATCLFLLCLGMVVVGIVLLSYVSTIDESQAKTLGQSAQQSQKRAVKNIQNYVNCSYNKCCSQHSIQNFTKAKCKNEEEVKEGVCTGLGERSSPSACETYDKYNKGILDWLQLNLTPLISAILGIAAVQLFAFCISMAFVCTEIRSGNKVGSDKVYET